MAYEQRSGPLGGRRGDYAAALIASTVANANRGKSRARTVEDFLPQWGGRRRRQMTPEEMLAKAREITVRMGGTVPA